MTSKPIALACDHAGLDYKNRVTLLLQQLGHTVADYGTHSADSCDYPDFAHAAASAVASGASDVGILVCGSGIGVSIVANKVQGVRAADCVTTEMAALSRQHNHANVLALGQRLVDWDTAADIVQAFLNTPPSADPRHTRRVDKIHLLTGL